MGGGCVGERGGGHGDIQKGVANELGWGGENFCRVEKRFTKQALKRGERTDELLEKGE